MNCAAALPTELLAVAWSSHLCHPQRSLLYTDCAHLMLRIAPTYILPCIPLDIPPCPHVPLLHAMLQHGVGGLVLYTELLGHVVALGQPVVVPDFKHVSMRLT